MEELDIIRPTEEKLMLSVRHSTEHSYRKEVGEDEKELKDAIRLVRAFAKCPDRTALTDSFIKSLKLLADTVESQMEEVK